MYPKCTSGVQIKGRNAGLSDVSATFSETVAHVFTGTESNSHTLNSAARLIGCKHFPGKRAYEETGSARASNKEICHIWYTWEKSGYAKPNMSEWVSSYEMVTLEP